MNRRNTIIIAILVNAGLLLVLFATAMRSGDKKEETAVKLAEAPLPVKEATSPVTTEELLNEYIAAAVPSEEEIVVIDDLVNGTTVLDTPASSTVAASAQPASSMPAIAPTTPAVKPTETTVASVPATSSAPKVAQAPKATTPAASNSEVVVKKGDYLEKIAKANGTTVDAIMKANHLSSTNLKVGQVLKLPSNAKSSESIAQTATPKTAPVTTQANDYYIVKEGDSPWLIASKCNVKLDELLRINNIDEQKAKKLRPGDKLKIR